MKSSQWRAQYIPVKCSSEKPHFSCLICEGYSWLVYISKALCFTVLAIISVWKVVTAKLFPCLALGFTHLKNVWVRNSSCYGWFLFLYSPVAHKGWNQKNRAASGRCREHGENLDQTAQTALAKKGIRRKFSPGAVLLTQQRRTLSSLDWATEGIRIYGRRTRFNSFFQKVRWAKLSQGEEGLITVYGWLTFSLAGKERVETRSWKMGPLPQAAFMKELDGGGSWGFSSVLFF